MSDIKRRLTLPTVKTKPWSGQESVYQIFTQSSETRMTKLKPVIKTKNLWARLLSNNGRTLREKEVDKLRKQLIQCCLTHMQDSYRVHLGRMKGLRILHTLATSSDIEHIEPELAMHMVWAALSCIHHFLLRLRSQRGLIQWHRRRQARKSIKAYDAVLEFLSPKFYALVCASVVTFFDEANLWDIDYFCSNLLQRVLLQGEDRDRADSIIELINLAESSTITNTLTSRQILDVVFNIGEIDRWSWVNNRLLDRFLDVYYCSITAEEHHDYNYETLEKSLEACLRSMTAHLEEKYQVFVMNWMLEALSAENIPNETVLHFGSVLEYVAASYTKRMVKRPLSEQVLPAVFRTIASSNFNYSLLGLRTLHNLVDRCNNRVKLDSPRVFLRDSHYNLVVNQYRYTDKLLFQRYREVIHRTIVQSMLTHGYNMIYVEHIYISVVLFMLEVPCAYTAAASACVAMAFQDAALRKKLSTDQANRVHATVISIMSLLCYIHKADVFYDYVEKILDKRADYAPHLNPPLQLQYKYAPHHVLWNEPDMFFEAWQTRYGLWRCFKTNRDLVVAKVE